MFTPPLLKGHEDASRNAESLKKFLITFPEGFGLRMSVFSFSSDVSFPIEKSRRHKCCLADRTL